MASMFSMTITIFGSHADTGEELVNQPAHDGLSLVEDEGKGCHLFRTHSALLCQRVLVPPSPKKGLAQLSNWHFASSKPVLSSK